MTQAEAWNRRFAELSAEASQIHGRVLRRYQELLRRVADGTQTPEAVQAQFAAYLQEHAATGTRELVEASVGMLAGLLYIEAKHREAAVGDLLPADEPIPPPPVPSSVDIANWFQVLSRYATEQSARGTARHQQLVERIARGEITAEEVKAQGLRYMESAAARFIDEVVDLGLGYASQMQRSSASLADGLYDRVLGPDPEQQAAPPEAALVLDLTGPADSVARAEVVVENTVGTTAWIECSVSEFSPRNRDHSFAADVEVVPARFSLGPGAGRDVAVTVRLSADRFMEDVDYFGILRIKGAGDREMIAQLIARAETPEVPVKPG